jgi:transcriptional regulator with XRE-family HTH domain
MAQRDAISAKNFLTQAEIGRRIAELRAERGVSQRQMADAVGLDQSALSRIETGTRGLAVEELVAIANFLAVDTNTLLLPEEDAKPLFRNEGGPGEAHEAVAALEAIVDDFFVFEAAARK